MNALLTPVQEYVEKLENADSNEKNRIENALVDIGEEAVPYLVDSIQSAEGRTRGILAMALIRIGESSIDYLKRAAKGSRDFEWIADYLITEIKGAAA